MALSLVRMVAVVGRFEYLYIQTKKENPVTLPNVGVAITTKEQKVELNGKLSSLVTNH